VFSNRNMINIDNNISYSNLVF